MNLKLTLGSGEDLLGYQQEIDNLTQVVSIDLINPAIDVEERKFKYKSGIGQTNINFYFSMDGGNTYGSNFKNAGFSSDEINNKSQLMLNSFFILDYYTTYDVNTQLKVFTTYITKLGTTPQYVIDSNNKNQFYYWYVPLDYINSQILLGRTITRGYVKFSFYNAKSGNITLFYNTLYSGFSTSLKMYFPTDLYLSDRSFILNPFPNIIAKQMVGNSEYTNKINNTFTNYNNLLQNYPNGSSFDYLTGKYFISSGGTTI